MSALTRRSFLQSSAVVAGAAAVVGPAAHAMGGGSSHASSTSSSSTSSSTVPSGGEDGHTDVPVGDPVIAYVSGSTVTVLSGEREVMLDDADLARRISRAVKNDS
jgi:hypothetical protein